ncbi:2-polyprenyl-3-methyl-5-hydroxy-6-metoxy-1,4-benzoquinol methylase [Variovorax boronicumulans]|uniref:2-polyprenyl-3-methyl-5-hydroxy-6-metoxy-1, 4-benzoquinol methylase n=1 Tax=Variovorax boronicumulans TaxID=436515 RepID=A0AAW8DSW6_9BURK|nr:class I SAM-dependent methyltransferase [Variovorax boronicumulans]MDP9876716.1 2-polyprenyl-3-methyl-5-hydroxy-6-metoxy-1,4-benzoquinol methylase [Variovorax boronicumulans]MDP9922407.1 2-polyprenyl-3-methyl-5-hydroxy-6-metoxy-1,4-benzoquinol methylase [Variovorax boronicumulans]
MTAPTPVREHMDRTIASYEASARDYNAIVAGHRPPEIEGAVRRMMQRVPAGGTVLEIGSGSGQDADFVESLGGIVRRTDAVQAFLDLQAERGKKGELLNVVTDALGGPYDAVLAMCVLIHVDRAQIAPVLRKVFDALAPGGVFLAAMRIGEGETLGDYQTVYWSKDAFADALAAAGLDLQWDSQWIGRDDVTWANFLACRPR